MNRGFLLAAGALALVACRDRRTAGESRAVESGAGQPADGPCVAIDYASQIDLAEASAAAWLPDPGVLLVVSDSGNRGSFAELDGRGAIVRRGSLPLGGAGDDVEGLSLVGDTLWGLTSGGWMRGWRRDGDAWKLAVDAFALDPARPCAPDSVNCGDNFEGLCLADHPLASGCDGYALAKASGQLLCVRKDGAGYTLDRTRGFRVGGPGQVADCAIAADGSVWTGDNGFGFMMVRSWAPEPGGGGTLTGAQRLGLGFPEVLAFGPDHTVYRFSDLGGAPSLTTAFRCPAGLPKAGPDDAAQ